MNEKLRRLFMKNPLIPVAVVLLGSVWFTMSILAFCIGLLLPWTKSKPPQQVVVSLPPRPGNSAAAASAPFIIRPAKSASKNSTSILASSKKDATNQHVSFPDVINIGDPPTTPRPRTVKRWSLPAGYPSSSAVTLDNSSLTSLGSTGSSTLVSSLRNYKPRLSLIESGDGTSGSESQITLTDTASGYVSCDSRMSDASVSSVTRKNSLTARLPLKVFRRRSTKGKEESSGYSSNSPLSTPPKAYIELKPEEKDTAISGEIYRSSFVSPFKFRPKRSSASATMMSNYKASENPTQMPGKFEDSDNPTPTSSAPSSPTDITDLTVDSVDRTSETPTIKASSQPPTRSSRRKPFSSYLNLNLTIQTPLPGSSVDSPRTRGGSFSSTASSSTASSSSHTRSFSLTDFSSPFTPSHRTPKLPKTPRTAGLGKASTPTVVARTQPYGAPYYAALPTGEFGEYPQNLTPSQMVMRRTTTTTTTTTTSSSIIQPGPGNVTPKSARPSTASRRMFGRGISGKARSEDESMVFTPTPTNALGLEAKQKVAFEEMSGTPLSGRRPRSAMGHGHKRMASDGDVPDFVGVGVES